jgi:glycosyltransferase involved in cell wall biosynthesis
VRNGLPFVLEAVESVRASTYRNFELVVQDGASTDGTLECLHRTRDLPISVVSSKDTGIGQAFNRALQRCRGEIVGSVDADNRLHPGALATVVRRFAEHPHAAVVYGGCDMISESGDFIHTWTAPDFDLLRLIDGSVVPPFATSFFSRAACGEALAFDEELPTVADFDLWLRLACLPIVRVFDVLAEVRVGRQSSTWTPDAYEGHCHFKIEALRRFLAGKGREVLISEIRGRAEAGIYLWAVDSMATIGAGQEYVDKYFEQALKTDLRSERFRRIVNAAHPTLPPQPSFRDQVLTIGIEYLRKGEPEAAVTYLELLEAWTVSPPTLEELSAGPRPSRDAQLQLADDLLNSAQDIDRRNRTLANLSQALHAEIKQSLVERSNLQAEVNRRDQLMNEVIGQLHAEINQDRVVREQLQAEVNKRDQLMNDVMGQLHAEINQDQLIRRQMQAEIDLRDTIIESLRARLPMNRVRRFLGMKASE